MEPRDNKQSKASEEEELSYHCTSSMRLNAKVTSSLRMIMPRDIF